MTGDIVLGANQRQYAWQLIRQVCQSHLGTDAPLLIEYNHTDHLAKCLTQSLQTQLTSARAILIQPKTSPFITTLLWLTPAENGGINCEIIDTTNDSQRTQRQYQLKQTIERSLATLGMTHNIQYKADNLAPSSDRQPFETYQTLRAFQLAIKRQNATQPLAVFGNTLNELMTFTFNCYYAANPTTHVSMDSAGNLISGTRDESSIPGANDNEAGYVIKQHALIANAHSQYEKSSRQYNVKFFTRSGDINDNLSLLAAAKLLHQEKSKRHHGDPDYLPIDFQGLDTERSTILTQHLFAVGFTHVNGIANPNSRAPAQLAESTQTGSLPEALHETEALNLRSATTTAAAPIAAPPADDATASALRAAEIRGRLAINAMQEAHRQRLEAESRLADAECRVTTQPDTLALLTTERDELTARVTTLAAEANQAAAREATHNALQSKQAKKLSRLESDVSRLTSEADTLRRRAEAVENTLKHRDASHRAEKHQLTTDSETRYDIVKRELDLLRPQLASAETAAQQAKDKLATASATLTASHAEHERTLTELREQAALSSTALETLKHKLTATEAELHAAKGEIRTLETKPDMQDASVDVDFPGSDLEAEKNRLALESIPPEMLEQATESLADEREAHAQTRAELTALRANHEDYEMLSREAQRLRDALDAQAHLIIEREHTADQAMATHEAHAATYTRSLISEHTTQLGDLAQAHEDEMRALEGQIAILKTSRDSYRSKTATSYEANAIAEKRISKLESQLKKLERTHQQLQHSAQRNYEESTQSRTENENLHHELKTLHDKCRLLQHALDASKAMSAHTDVEMADPHTTPFTKPPAPTQRARTNHRALALIKQRHKADLEALQAKLAKTQEELQALQSTHVKKETKGVGTSTTPTAVAQVNVSTDTTCVETSEAQTQADLQTPREERLATTTHRLLAAMGKHRTHHTPAAQCIETLLKIGCRDLSVMLMPFDNLPVSQGFLMGLKTAVKHKSDEGNHRAKLTALTTKIQDALQVSTSQHHRMGIFRKSIAIDASLKKATHKCASALYKLTTITPEQKSALNKLRLPNKSFNLHIGDHIEDTIAYLAAFSLEEDALIKLTSDIYAAVTQGDIPDDAPLTWTDNTKELHALTSTV